MLKDMYTAALGMQPLQTRLEITANNIANVNSIGFKRQNLFENKLIEAKNMLNNIEGNAEQTDVNQMEYTDFKKGGYIHTGNPLDVAIQDDGFFVIEAEDGERRYTRAGNFQLSKEGNLITPDGRKLLGKNGPINVMQQQLSSPMFGEGNNGVSIIIKDSGEVYANDSKVGTIEIAYVENKSTLIREENQTFRAIEQTQIQELEGETSAIKQGWIESSNVDVVTEMVNMIELQRMYEAGRKVITTSDQTIDNSLRVGRLV